MVKKVVSQSRCHPRRHPRIKKDIFVVVVTLLFVFFVAYATETFFPSPGYGDFCEHKDVLRGEVLDEQQCLAVGGEWNTFDTPKEADGEMVSDGWCDVDFSCRQEYDVVREGYERNLFMFNLIFGLVVFLVAFFLSVDAVSAGFMGGGALLMVYGTLRYWGDLSNGLRTFFLGVALAVLVWFGYKKLND